MKNYSRQREAILNVLRGTNTHPTAAWIYEKTREVIPNISLGTVYRNLAALTEAGDILCLDVGDGQEHFDGDITSHLHLHCKGCKNIADVELASDPFVTLAEDKGFNSKISAYVIYGYCKECIQNKN